MNNEVWKDIPGLGGAYQASSLGRVRSIDRNVWQVNRWGELMRRTQRGAVLACRPDRDGYLRTFSRGFKETAMHRLVALAFIPNPLELPQVNHKNGDKADNRPENLEWCDNSFNHLHRVHVLGGHLPQPIVKRTRISYRGEFALTFDSASAAARMLGVVGTAVTNAAKSGGKCQGCEVSYV